MHCHRNWSDRAADAALRGGLSIASQGNDLIFCVFCGRINRESGVRLFRTFMAGGFNVRL